MTLTAYLEQKSPPPKYPAFIEANSNRTVTYEEFWESVRQLAVSLRRLGFQPGERVVVALPNSVAWVTSFLALLKVGGIVIPLRQSATPSELKQVITHVKPSLFITDSAFINRSLPFDLLDVKEQTVIFSKRFMVLTIASKRISHFDKLFGHGYPAEFATSSTPPSQPVASIHYTFRGYGYPLGAALTHENFVNGITTYVQTAGLCENQRFLAALPFSHTYPLVGCLLAPLAVSGTVIITQNSSGQCIWEAIQRYQPNVLTGVPAMYTSLLRTTSSSAELNVEEAICGGSIMPVSLYEQFYRRWYVSLRQGYGLTECLPVTCNPSRGNRPETLGKVVVGVDGVDVKVFGEGSQEKPVGEVGEIVVRGPTVMAGYYAMSRETSEAIRDGWFYSGDYGWFDRDGYLHFAGVKKRIAKVGGNMVDLAEVEREILACPNVLRVKVYTVPDKKFGELVNADITYRDGVPHDESTIRRYLKNRLASYKVPFLQSLKCA